MAPLALAAVFFLPLHYFAIFIAAAFLIGAWEWSLFCGYKTKLSQYSFVAVVALSMALIYGLLGDGAGHSAQEEPAGAEREGDEGAAPGGETPTY